MVDPAARNHLQYVVCQAAARVQHARAEPLVNVPGNHVAQKGGLAHAALAEDRHMLTPGLGQDGEGAALVVDVVGFADGEGQHEREGDL